ncbi:hypothetical protein FISHEDRAFT_69604 [Fistulina hepatica ATCC 64428]|uniref:Uncharacterized protein n=1 Tax=Fistulina hepatica ATCC 64428 TaxID=1128425 RepID=A0A0D7ALQ5_9AGAR|nr:hypothetical protein FISHEDRAFT_69604 [Fistulina hepatica ATCC 64428]
MGANDDTLGALLIGVVIACLFLGASLVQTYTYFTVYKTDPWFIKVTVTIPVLCNIVHQIGITDKIYLVMVTHYGDYAILDDIGWGLLFDDTLYGYPETYGEYLYSCKTFQLNYIYAHFPSFHPCRKQNLVTGVNGTAAGLDIIIASIILFMLMSYRTGFRP